MFVVKYKYCGDKWEADFIRPNIFTVIKERMKKDTRASTNAPAQKTRERKRNKHEKRNKQKEITSLSKKYRLYGSLRSRGRSDINETWTLKNGNTEEWKRFDSKDVIHAFSTDVIVEQVAKNNFNRNKGGSVHSV